MNHKQKWASVALQAFMTVLIFLAVVNVPTVSGESSEPIERWFLSQPNVDNPCLDGICGEWFSREGVLSVCCVPYEAIGSDNPYFCNNLIYGADPRDIVD